MCPPSAKSAWEIATGRPRTSQGDLTEPASDTGSVVIREKMDLSP